MAHRSGRTSKPCSMRPMVPGNEPPPWAKPMRSAAAAPARRRRSASRWPSRSRPACRPARAASTACMPVARPSCPRGARRPPRRAPARPRRTGTASGRRGSTPLTWVPICTPGRPSSRTQRSSSRDRQVGRLHRHGAEAGEAVGMVAHDAGDVVVEQPREVERVCSAWPSSRTSPARSTAPARRRRGGRRPPGGRPGPRCWRRPRGSRVVDHHPRRAAAGSCSSRTQPP